MSHPHIHKIIRSKRKTIALHIEQDATLTIRAPWHTSMRYIEKIVKEKSGWITKKQAEAHQKKVLQPKHQFIAGEQFLYLGTFYNLEIIEKQMYALVFREGFYLKLKVQQQGRRYFTQWYKKAAQFVFEQRVAHYAPQMNIQYKSIRITSAQTRWGSCSPGGKLNFTWRLVMAPLQVIDSVVIHELAHIEHPNHSKKFWAKVESIMPEYKKYRSWLRAHGHRLQL